MEKRENETELWGTSWISRNLVDYIDEVRQNDNPQRKEDVAMLILRKLQEEGIPVRYLRHLRLDFVDPNQERPKQKRKGISQQVEKIILEQFGTETIKRLDFELTPQAVHKIRRI